MPTVTLTVTSNFGNDNLAYGINDADQIVGQFLDYFTITGGHSGFLYNDGTYTPLGYPSITLPDGSKVNTVEAFAAGINNAGQVVGWYFTNLNVEKGFVESGGIYTILNANTYPHGINDAGQIVGSYANGGGFYYSSGTYTSIEYPSFPNTVASGINDAGQVVGYYYDSNNSPHGFLESGGIYTTIDDPLGTEGTYARGINNIGQVVGSYIDSSGNVYGFLESGGIYTTIVAVGAFVLPYYYYGINDADQVVGYAQIINSVSGFVGTPFSSSPGNVDEWILWNGHWEASAGPGSHPAGSQVAAVGDFTGTGTDGILWYNSSTGDVDEWKVSFGAWAGSVDLGSHPGNFQIAGVGDFTGDGTDDVLWTSTGNGQVQTDIWELSNGQWAASVGPGTHPAGYQVAGVGDFTGKRTDDILWQNRTTGDVDEWQIAGGKWAASVDLGTHPGAGWTITGVGDFTANGIDDILWSNSSNGQVQTDIWELGSNGQWINSFSPGSHPAGYQVVGIGDFTGNGTSDILWQNPTSGDVDEWLINNGIWAGSIDLGTHPGNNQIAGIGDFTGNGTSDILWHSSS